ncbi:Glucokinase [Giardia muris]|uniref:Glucokinase n=1 Tax=Giardia muris TaxID=5742 RepID=A0A4Z1SS61_GIAMU|nr:Glucokinase [Giardia muris]|eukprot:TNJ28736.1 Glucokinase [Giardia muris]
MPFILAGDVGCTKAFLAVYDCEAECHASSTYERYLPSARYTSLLELVMDFLSGWTGDRPIACCLGVAGPVDDGRVNITNLDWDSSEEEISHGTGIPCVRLINDFAAFGYGTHVLVPDDLLVFDFDRKILQKPEAVPCTKKGVTAYLGAGTGLGAGFIVDGIPYPSEGGNISLSSLECEDLEYARFILAKYDTDFVSFEDMVSGLGLHDLHDFYWQCLHSLAGPAIRQHVLETEGRIDIEFFAKCAETGDRYALKIFRKFFYYYGVFISNMVVVFRPKNLFIAGGILAKNLSLLMGACFDEFKRGLLCKWCMRGFPEMTPTIHLVTNLRAGLLGALYCAMSLV